MWQARTMLVPQRSKSLVEVKNGVFFVSAPLLCYSLIDFETPRQKSTLPEGSLSSARTRSDQGYGHIHFEVKCQKKESFFHIHYLTFVSD